MLYDTVSMKINIRYILNIIIIIINIPALQMHLFPDNSKFKEVSHFVQAFGLLS